jgi:hypothetical protein
MTRPPIGAREEVLLELFFSKKKKEGKKTPIMTIIFEACKFLTFSL